MSFCLTRLILCEIYIEMLGKVQIVREVIKYLIELIEDLFRNLVSVHPFASNHQAGCLKKLPVELSNMFREHQLHGWLALDEI
jgi:hypothetical protein